MARFWHIWNSFLTKIQKICQNQILARFRSFCILSSIWAQKSKNRAISDLEPIYLVVISQKTAPMVYFPIWRFLIWHDMMLKKKVNWFLSKKKPFFGRAVEGLFLSTAGPKRGWLSYLIAIIKKETSGLWRSTLIVVRYEKHSLFGPALDKN